MNTENSPEEKNSSQVNSLLNSNKQRNKTLDVYKGILIILVVIRHVLQYSVSDEGGILTNFIWAVQMPGFMLISGYFAARKIDSFKMLAKRILLSSLHYALPFFSWFLLIDVLLLGYYGRNPITGLIHLFYHVDSGLWFLWVIFILSCVTALASYALAAGRWKIAKTGCVLVIVLAVLLGIAKLAGINFLGIKYILYYAVFYGFGWLTKWTEDWWKQWWPKAGNIIVFLCLGIFLGIVFNFDLYHNDDGIISIVMRIISGFAGNAVILTTCKKYETVFNRIHLDKLGLFTLEIYATHMCVNRLMAIEVSFFTFSGLINFVCSLILTVIFTTVIIAVFKSIPAADLIFYGKTQKIRQIK
jgi:fucose 4-O-acetylase-like acetyltransferase